ncbi:MAG: MerR family transcriptional regulator [Alphaproteobacteria bacterium]|nr:MerR family transcriptional regulator [Alphaproteobacteria bacterium]
MSEVASELGIHAHVLRFWESKFPQIRPLKRGGRRRYYRPEDIELLRRIHGLRYNDRYTIEGVQKLLRTGGNLNSLNDTIDALDLATDHAVSERNITAGAAAIQKSHASEHTDESEAEISEETEDTEETYGFHETPSMEVDDVKVHAADSDATYGEFDREALAILDELYDIRSMLTVSVSR